MKRAGDNYKLQIQVPKKELEVLGVIKRGLKGMKDFEQLIASYIKYYEKMSSPKEAIEMAKEERKI